MTYTDFVELHKPQLANSKVPERFWHTLFEKLKDEVYDAGNSFQMICEKYSTNEDDDDAESACSWKVIVYSEDGISHMDEKNIFLIDHAWTFRVPEARKYLEQVPGLLERMTALMEVDTTGRSGEEQIEDVLTNMWRFNQTYTFGNADRGTEDGLPLWYIMDEFGSRIQHSDEPSFQTAPFFFIPGQISFTIMWPSRDLQHGEEVTRDYLPSVTDPMKRSARLLPWVHSDLTDVSCKQEEPDASYFEAFRQSESLPDVNIEFPVIPRDRKLKVFFDFSETFKKHLDDPQFELTEDLSDADIIWLHTSYKDFKELAEEFPGKLINQFPCEMVVTIKDLLPIVARRAVKTSSDPGPKWLPVTYCLQRELPQFVSYYQQREALGLDNHYICKPWNLVRGLDIHVTKNLNHIVRLPDSGPKVACKYIEAPVLFHRDDVGHVKFDIRYVVLLSSVKPLKLFAYNIFWLRFSNKPFSLDHFDDYEKHMTVMNYKEGCELKQIHCEDFVPMFNSQFPEFKWDDVEQDIFTMIRELFEAASSKPPPQGIAPSRQSRAIYAIDLMLNWDKNEKGERYMQPMICEVNFGPDCDRACLYHPFFINDIFNVLFLDKTEGKHVTLISSQH